MLKLEWRAQSQPHYIIMAEERNHRSAIRCAVVETPQPFNPSRRDADQWFPEGTISALNSKRTSVKQAASPNLRRKSLNLPYSHLSLLIPAGLWHNGCEVFDSHGDRRGNCRYPTSLCRLDQSCGQGPSHLRRSSVSSWFPHPGQHNLQSLFSPICEISWSLSSEDHRTICSVSCLARGYPH